MCVGDACVKCDSVYVRISHCVWSSLLSFRQTCTQIAKKQFNDKWSTKRVEFIPVEWRTWLSLDKGEYGDCIRCVCVKV